MQGEGRLSLRRTTHRGYHGMHRALAGEPTQNVVLWDADASLANPRGNRHERADASLANPSPRPLPNGERERLDDVALCGFGQSSSVANWFGVTFRHRLPLPAGERVGVRGEPLQKLSRGCRGVASEPTQKPS